MKKDLNEELVMLEMKIKKLSGKAQQAIYWIVENFDFAVRICKDSNMTDEEIEKYRKISREKEDHIVLALLCVVEMCKNEGSEPMEIEQQNL